MATEKTYACAICGRLATRTYPLPPDYPFCSARCRRVDLGRWFREDYVIPRELTPEDLADAEDERPPSR